MRVCRGAGRPAGAAPDPPQMPGTRLLGQVRLALGLQAGRGIGIAGLELQAATLRLGGAIAGGSDRGGLGHERGVERGRGAIWERAKHWAAPIARPIAHSGAELDWFDTQSARLGRPARIFALQSFCRPSSRVRRGPSNALAAARFWPSLRCLRTACRPAALGHILMGAIAQRTRLQPRLAAPAAAHPPPPPTRRPRPAPATLSRRRHDGGAGRPRQAGAAAGGVRGGHLWRVPHAGRGAGAGLGRDTVWHCFLQLAHASRAHAARLPSHRTPPHAGSQARTTNHLRRFRPAAAGDAEHQAVWAAGRALLAPVGAQRGAVLGLLRVGRAAARAVRQAVRWRAWQGAGGAPWLAPPGDPCACAACGLRCLLPAWQLPAPAASQRPHLPARPPVPLLSWRAASRAAPTRHSPPTGAPPSPTAWAPPAACRPSSTSPTRRRRVFGLPARLLVHACLLAARVDLLPGAGARAMWWRLLACLCSPACACLLACCSSAPPARRRRAWGACACSLCWGRAC